MDIDTNKDGRVDMVEGLAFAQGFLSAATADVMRILTLAVGALTLAASLWNATHPTQAVPVPAAPPPASAPLPPPADTDAPTPVPVDAVAPVGGAS